MLIESNTRGGLIPSKRQKLGNEKKTRNLENDTEVEKRDGEVDEWVPPQGQSGDGRTSLNDKFGY